jgi:hypothetical protein
VCSVKGSKMTRRHRCLKRAWTPDRHLSASQHRSARLSRAIKIVTRVDSVLEPQSESRRTMIHKQTPEMHRSQRARAIEDQASFVGLAPTVVCVQSIPSGTEPSISDHLQNRWTHSSSYIPQMKMSSTSQCRLTANACASFAC